MESLFNTLISSLWPRRCIFCSEPMFEKPDLTCDRCKEKLPYIKGKVCTTCGRERSECTCSSSTLYYDEAAAPFYFEKDVRKCIHSFKFRGETEIADPLSEHMLKIFKERYGNEQFDLITCVPLHDDDMKTRGYNQSRLLAENLCNKTGIAFNGSILRKIYRTEKQSSTLPLERYGNVLGVFEVDKNTDLTGMKILLIDDVETTGSTLSECGKMLFLAGAQRVCCLSAALTRIKKKGRD